VEPVERAPAEVAPGGPDLDGVGVTGGVVAGGSHRRATAAAVAVLLGAVTGVFLWPVAFVAFVAALPLARRRDGGRLARAAVLAAALGAYCALATMALERY
jgi:hypothetical protein